MKIASLLAALSAGVMLSGCATVTRGTHETFGIMSQPSGADVKMTTEKGLTMVCTTPCQMKLRRKDAFIAHITKAGYQPMDVTVSANVHGGGGAAMAGNLLAGGLIGGVIDGTNGSMLDLKPNPINVTLVPEQPAPVAAPAPAPVAAAAPAPAPAAAAPAAKPAN